jgi:hypothetical protein
MRDDMNTTEEPDSPELASALTALGSLDEVIHQKVRLALMSTLISLGESDFTQLRDLMSLSDGNLATHLALLEDKGYLAVTKQFIRKKPRTSYRATVVGIRAFREYVKNLETILGIASASAAESQPVYSLTLMREART